jgi:hypothetical protein
LLFHRHVGWLKLSQVSSPVAQEILNEVGDLQILFSEYINNLMGIILSGNISFYLLSENNGSFDESLHKHELPLDDECFHDLTRHEQWEEPIFRVLDKIRNY